MAKITRLSVVRSEQKATAAKNVRREIYTHIGDIIRDAGDEVAGFAVVVWDTKGCNWSSFKSGGAVKSRLIPSFAESVLTQHVACDLVRDGN